MINSINPLRWKGEGGRVGRGERGRMRRRSVMLRGHTRWFFLINSNVRKTSQRRSGQLSFILSDFLRGVRGWGEAGGQRI